MHTQGTSSRDRDYDDLTAQEQEVVRAGWKTQMAARIAGLDLAEHFRRSGDRWVELDSDGNVVHRDPLNGSAPT